MEKTVSCLAQGGGEADFLLLQPLSHHRKASYFFEEARMLSCEMSRLNIIHQWIIFWDMNERKTTLTSPEFKV